MGRASKKVECGARARMGATDASTRRPLVATQWKPPAKKTARAVSTTKGRSQLFNRAMKKEGNDEKGWMKCVC